MVKFYFSVILSPELNTPIHLPFCGLNVRMFHLILNISKYLKNNEVLVKTNIWLKSTIIIKTDILTY